VVRTACTTAGTTGTTAAAGRASRPGDRIVVPP